MKHNFKNILCILLCLTMMAGIWTMPLGVVAAGTAETQTTAPTTNWVMNLPDYESQVDKYHANIFNAPALQIYNKAINLGNMDLSYYSTLKITYSSAKIADGALIGLSSTNTWSDNVTTTDEIDIASGPLVNEGDMTNKRSVEIDLTDVDYSGDVWLTMLYESGNLILIFEVELVLNAPADIETRVSVHSQIGHASSDADRSAPKVTGTMSYRTKINSQFTGARIIVPTYGAQDDSDYTLSLYQWKGTYALTLAQTPVATKEFLAVGDGGNDTTDWLTFDAQPAGEYLFHIEKTGTDTIAVWKYSASTKGYVYTEGVESAGDIEMAIKILGDGTIPADLIGTCSATSFLKSPNTDMTEAGNKLFAGTESSVSVRLRVNAPMSGFQFKMADGGSATSSKEIDFSVYTWKGTYEATIAEASLVTKRIPMKNLAWQGITFDEIMPAGDYLFIADNWSCTDPADNFVFYTYNTAGTLTGGMAFEDGVLLTDKSPLVKVDFVEECVDNSYFLSTDILVKGYQAPKEMVADAPFNVRFLAVIKDLDYKNVGFDITETGTNRTWRRDIKQVFTSLNATTKDGTEMKAVTAEELGGAYIAAFTITDIPVGQALTFEVKPYVTLLSGEKIYQNAYVLTITEEGVFYAE